MSSLSQKDKNTLIILGVALLIFGIAFLGIKPAFASIKETKATNDQLTSKKIEMKTEIESLPTYKIELENAKVNYNKTADRVFGDLTNDYIHDEVCALVASIPLGISSFSVGDISESSIPKYSVLVEDVESASAESTSGGVRLANISVSVSGTKAAIISFIDTINNDEGLFLQNVSFSGSDGETSVNVTFVMVLSETFA